MASKYLDLPVRPAFEDITLADSATTNNVIQITFDTTVSREELRTTLRTVADALLTDTRHSW